MSKPIRILNMFTIMNRGGAETMVMNHYRNIDRSKVQFDFLVHRQEKGAYDDEIEALGGRIYRMIPIYPQNFLQYKKDVRDFFREHKEYKIIHSHMSELGYFAFKEAKNQGIPIRICHAHNTPHDFDLKMIMRNYFKYAMRPYITHMFTCSKDSGIWLYGKKNIDKLIQMNNAIDAKKFKFNKDFNKKVRKNLGIENKLVIGHVGRFNKQKNHEKVIDIFNEILKLNSNACLILVGEGNLKEEIKNKVSKLGLSNNVLFLGSRDDVNEIMQAFDVFLFPSLYEGLGIVLIEAQAAGIPCLTSDKVVPIEAKVTSLLNYYPLENNSNLWAKKTLDILTEKYDTYNEIKKAGFDIQNNAKWLEEFYINEYNKYNK